MGRQHLGSFPHRQSRRWNVERLEDRRLLAVAWVTTELDVVDFNDGLTSLREALFATNVLAGPDTIEFDSSLNGTTIFLSLGELKISDDLQIVGNSATPIVIDAGGREMPQYPSDVGSRVFLIDDGDDETQIEVSLNGLTATGGRTFVSGAGIHNREDLRLDRVRVEANRNWSDERGAGIYSTLGKLEIVESVVSGNLGSIGGGICVHNGALDVVDSLISNNRAVFTGAALHLTESTATLKSTTIQGNVPYIGATIISDSGSLVLDSCTFTDNGLLGETAPSISSRGGQLRIQRSVLARNFGGVIGSNGGMLEVIRSTLVGNYGSPGGSAVIGVHNTDASVVESYIGENLTGAIYQTDGKLRIRSSTISGNSAWVNPVALGLFGNATIESSTISGNAGEYYSPIDIKLDAAERVHFAHCTITNNHFTSYFKPGAITHDQRSMGQVVLEHAVVADNWLVDTSDPNESLVPRDVGGVVEAFWSAVGAVTVPMQGNSNLIGVDPRLGPLADNGGTRLPDGAPLLTHALLPDSPLIDLGDPARAAGAGGTPEYDQRGLPFGRVYGGRIDIGAVEWQPMPAALHGDFNDDGMTDSADYSVWRDGLGTGGLVPYSGADGDGDGDVDQDDYEVWRVNFGRVAGSGGGGVAIEIRSSYAPQGVSEEGTAEHVSSGTQVEPVVGVKTELGNQPPTLPGVLWMAEPVASGDGTGASARGELRREPSLRSTAVVDRALVAWLAERRAERGGVRESLDARVCGTVGEEVDAETAELVGSLNVAERALI